MPDKSPRWWLQAIAEARRVHFGQERLDRWNMAAQYYRSGAAVPELRKAWANEAYEELADDGIRINIVQGLIENFVSATIPQDIRAKGLAKRPGGDKAARNVQELFNNDFIPNSRLNEKLDVAASMGAIYSDAFAKIGFTELPRTRFDPETEVLTDDESTLQLGAEMEDSDSTVDQGETPWYDIIHPTNVIPAPGTMRLDEAPWVAIKMRKRYSELLKNRNYQRIDDVKPMTADKDDWDDNPNREQEMLSGKEEGHEESGEDYLDIYEIWHLEERKLLAVAHGNHEIFIRNQDWPHDGLEGYPIAHLQFKRDPEAFFGISMIQDVADLQDELNISSNYMIDAMKRAMPFIVVDKNAIDTNEKGDIAEADLMGIVSVDLPAGAPLSSAIDVFPKGSAFSPDLYGVRNMIIQSILLVSGQSDFMIGQSQKTKSATEVAATTQGLTSRLGYKRKLFLRFVSDILKKTYQISRDRMTEPRFIRTVGLPGANITRVTPEDLRHELEVDLDAQMAETQGEDPVRLKVVSDALAPFLNLELAVHAGIDLVAFSREYLRAAGIKDIDSIQPGAREPTDAEDEHILLAEGIQIEPHPQDLDQDHIQEHMIFQDGLDADVQVVVQEHINKHLRNLQVKMAAIQQRNAGLGQAGQATTGANEAPSRTSASADNGNTQARGLQATN